jgi:hypothetical protein
MRQSERKHLTTVQEPSKAIRAKNDRDYEREKSVSSETTVGFAIEMRQPIATEEFSTNMHSNQKCRASAQIYNRTDPSRLWQNASWGVNIVCSSIRLILIDKAQLSLRFTIAAGIENGQDLVKVIALF